MLRRVMLIACAVGAALNLSGCMVVGYSSRGGGFIFPGGIGLLVMLAVLWFLVRRR